jgi:hypothetical protein
LGAIRKLWYGKIYSANFKKFWIGLKKNCQICENNAVKILLDFGLLPLCNRFSSSPNKESYYYPLILGQCESCGLIQLTETVPASEITPIVDWLKYSEPEDHLDSLAKIICDLKNLPDNPVACGITYKDDSLLMRLKENSFVKTWRIDPEQDLGIIQKGIAGETIIPKLTTSSVSNISDKYGFVDVVIARHILEHALDTQAFLSLIWNMIKPGGYIVFEVPDCTKQLKFNDYSMPWEEHILYFIPETLKSSFGYTSYDLVKYLHYPYKTEDAQVVIVQKPQVIKLNKNIQITSDKFISANEYADNYKNHKHIVYSYLKEYVSKVGKIVFYGAGHLSVMLIKSLNIENFIECVVDDTEHKQGLYLPGTSLLIRPSEFLKNENISLCILSLSVEYEDRIVNNNQQFVDKGGVFLSAFSMQENSLFNSARNNLQL